MTNRVSKVLGPNRRLWLLALPVIAIGSVVAATTAWNSNPEVVEPRARVLPVDVLEVREATSVLSTRHYSGTVAARRSSDLGFERASRVASVRVDEGDRVARGQALASLDVRDLEILRQQVQAQEAEAKARLAELMTGPRQEIIDAARARLEELSHRRQLAELQRDRRQALLARQAISKEEFDVVSSEARTVQAAEQAANRQLDELLAGTRPEQVQMQRAAVDGLSARLRAIDLDIEKSTLRAPFAGLVARRMVDEGTVVSPGLPVLSVVESAAPELRVGVPVEVARGIRVGEKLPVVAGERVFEAEALAVLPELNAATRSATVLLRLPDEASASLLPGQVTRLRMEQALPLSGFWIPLEALTKGSQGLWACYALEAAPGSEGGVYRLARRDVEILHTEEDRALVRGTLSDGERIVRGGINRIAPGQLVSVDERAPGAAPAAQPALRRPANRPSEAEVRRVASL